MSKFKRIILIVIVTIVIGYVVIQGYSDAQPKTSIDLVMKLETTEIESYDDYSLGLTENDYKEIKDFVLKSGISISQFTILERENEVLILETTPGIVDNRIKIKNVRKISKEDFERFFREILK